MRVEETLVGGRWRRTGEVKAQERVQRIVTMAGSGERSSENADKGGKGQKRVRW